MRTKERPLNVAKLLKDANYYVNLVVLSVPQELSIFSIKYRYRELKRLGHLLARFTKKSSHDETYESIERNLEALSASGLFDRFFVYTRVKNGFEGNIFEPHQRELMLEAFKKGRSRIAENNAEELMGPMDKEIRDANFPIR
jgi:hypothetical protein